MLSKNDPLYLSENSQYLIFVGFILLIGWISLDIFEIYQRDSVFAVALVSTFILFQIWSLWNHIKTLIKYTHTLELLRNDIRKFLLIAKEKQLEVPFNEPIIEKDKEPR